MWGFSFFDSACHCHSRGWSPGLDDVVFGIQNRIRSQSWMERLLVKSIYWHNLEGFWYDIYLQPTQWFFIKSQRWTSPRLGMPELSISVAKLSCDLRFLEPFVPIYVVWRPEKVLSLLVPIYCMFPHIQIGTPLYLFTFVHRSTPHTHTHIRAHTHIYIYICIHTHL